MKYLQQIIIGLLIIFTSCNKATENNKQAENKHLQEISFITSDSITVFGDLYEINKKKSTILLFHQSGSNARGEYYPIIPELINEGYNVLAVDQRQGGQLYGGYNRTIAKFSLNNYSYCDASLDLEAALNFIIESGFSGNIILWGSSYSASLVIRLANQRQNDISGVLAFSPASGGPMKECRPDDFFETLKIPLLLLRPSKEMEIESVKNQFELAQQNNHQVYIAKYGIHGSSMLVESRVEHNVNNNWKVVKSFLKSFKE